MTAAQSDPLKPADAPPEGDAAHFATTRGKLGLWTGVLGGPIVWSLQMQTGYALSRFSSEHRWLLVVHHLVSLLGVAGAAYCTWLAWREWQRLGGGEPGGSEPGATGRSRFLALLGVITSGLFTLVIIAQWVPVFFISPDWY
jgi:hypothetical protein